MQRIRRVETVVAAAVFAGIPVVVMTAAVLCAWGIAHGASSRWRLPFLLLCHGIPARSYVMWGASLPICARCTGLYAGFFVGLATFFVWPAMPERWLRVGAATAAFVLAADGLTQLAHLRESTNDLRLATGLACGWTFGMWVLSAIERPRAAISRSP